MPIRTLILLLLRALFLGRQGLVLENLALRQQLAVLKRKVSHPRLADRDRRFRLMMRAVHEGWKDTHLVHDNDGSFQGEFRRLVEAMGIIDLPITPGRWQQNAYCERVIGTLRRECTDHLIVLNERHLLRAVREYVEQYYNVARPHLRLERNSPIPRTRKRTPAFELRATPVLGGLHHRYQRAA